VAFDVFKQQCRATGRVILCCPSFERSLPEGLEPIFDTRSVISVISSSGETSSRMRRSSPCFSSALIPVAQIVVCQGRALPYIPHRNAWK